MVDKQDGHIPGRKPKEVVSLMNLGFFLRTHVLETQGSGRGGKRVELEGGI